MLSGRSDEVHINVFRWHVEPAHREAVRPRPHTQMRDVP